MNALTVLVGRLSDRSSQDDRERPVEIVPCTGWECIPLPRPCDRLRKRAGTDRDIEGLLQPTPPRLQVGIAQPVEPWIVGSEVVDLLEEAERHHQREEGMRDR